MPDETDIFNAIQKKYPGDAYAVLPQVRSKTGATDATYADAMAFGLWPSRGLEVEGFEIKVSRGDWQRELKNPAKAEKICQYCDRWWLVVGDETIVKDGELPETWGLLEYKNGALKVKTKAPKLNPAPMPRDFIASVFRNMASSVTPNVLINQQLTSHFEEGKKTAETIFACEREAHKELQETLRKFQEASGVDIDKWRAGQIGAAVKFVLDFGPEALKKRLWYTRGQFVRIISEIDQALGTTEQERNTDALESD